jgi:protein tyrosine phosphatase
MRSLIRRLADKRPVVAHCSAGIGLFLFSLVHFLLSNHLPLLPGRSGSYTAIEMAYYELTTRQNRNFNMTEMMRQLRDQRAQSVQKDQQYLFVHRLVLEVLLSEKVIEKTDKVSQFCKDYEDLVERKKAEAAKQRKKK